MGAFSGRHAGLKICVAGCRIIIKCELPELLPRRDLKLSDFVSEAVLPVKGMPCAELTIKNFALFAKLCNFAPMTKALWLLCV